MERPIRAKGRFERGRRVKSNFISAAGRIDRPVEPGTGTHGEILMTFVGHAVSHAIQSMQSDSRIMSDLSHRYCCHSASPFSTTLSLPVPFFPGASNHS